MLSRLSLLSVVVAASAAGCINRSTNFDSLSAASLTLANPALVVDPSVSTTVTVALRASFGDVANAPVVLESMPPGPDFTQPTRTSAAGVAVGQVTCATAGTFVIYATVQANGYNQQLSQTATLSCRAKHIPVLKDIVLSLQPTTLVADGVSEGALTLTAYDDSGNTMPGQAVTFSSNGTSVVFLPETGYTGPAGTLAATVASTTVQSATITAQVGALAATANVTFTLGTATRAVVALSPTSLAVGGQSTVTVTVYDAQGRTVPGEGVTLSASGVRTQFGATAGTTLASGAFSTTVTSTTAQAETITATFPIFNASAAVTFVPGPPSNANCFVSASPNTNVAAGAPIAVTVSIADAFGNPINAQAVTFSASGSNTTFTPGNGNTTNGVLNTTATSTHAQNENVVATMGGVTSSASIGIVAASPNSVTSFLTAAPTTVVANNANNCNVTVTVEDAYGNPVSGAALIFGSSGTANTFSQPSGSTGSLGTLSTQLVTRKAEVKTVFVNVAGNFNETAVVTFVAGAPSNPNCTISATPNTNVVAGTSSAISVSVADAFGNPIVGQAVSLSASGGNNTFTPANGNTVAGGLFSSSLVSTRAQNENIVATASPASVSTTVGIIAGSPNSATSYVLANPNSVVADGSSVSLVTVTVNDAYGNLVNSAPITFGSSGVSFTFSPPVGATNISGQLTSSMSSTHAELKTAFANVAGNFNETAQIKFTAGPPVATQSSLAVSPASGTLANGISSATINASLFDQFHNAVPNWPMSLSATSTSSPAFALSTNSNAQGIFVTPLTSAFAGPKQVSLYTNGFVLNANVSFAQPIAYCSNPNGAFYGLPPMTPGLSSAAHVAAALLNNDLFPDIVVADAGTNSIAIAMGVGNGRFSSFGPYATGSLGTTRVATCDFNNDGHTDILALNSTSGNVEAYTASASGSGYPASSVTTTLSGSNLGIGSIACAALTGSPSNPNRDIIVGSSAGKKIWVSLNQGGAYAASATFTSFSQPVYGLGIADLTGDGNRDAFFADNGGHVLVAAGLGNGLFSAAISYTVLGAGVAVAACDLNHDGALDLVHAGTSTNVISTLLNNGTGTFTLKGSFSTLLNPNSIACADFNGDGNPDVAATSDNVSQLYILYGAGNGTFASAATLPPLGLYQTSLAVADFNQDQNVDIIASYLSNGDSGAALMLGGPTAFRTYKQFVTGNGPLGIAAGDIDGDGRPDLAVTTGTSPYQAQVFINGGASQTFIGPTSYSLTDQPVSIALVDLNNDGALDMAISLQTAAGGVEVLVNNGSGTFAAASRYPAGGTDWGMGVGDFNGDGHVDLVSGNRSNNTVTTLRGNATATYPANVAYTLGASGSNPAEIAIGDFNLDGNQDVAAALYGTTQVGTLFGNGDGTFGTPHTYSPSGTGSGGIGGISIVDLNLDGYPDVATSDIQGYLSTFLGSASGTLTASQHMNADGLLYLAITADINGDGIPDLITPRHSQAALGVYYGVGDGTFHPEIFYATGNAPYGIAVADFDADGHADFAEVDQSDNFVSVHYYSGCP